jgi:hypothetical protein
MTIPIPYDLERSQGVWIGLRMALDILTRETARQEHRAAVANRANPLANAGPQHALVVAVLRDVSKQVAAEFRRGAS